MYCDALEEATEATLVPNLKLIVALIERIVTLGWPDADDDQGDYFRQLGFHQGVGQEGFSQGYGYSPGPESAEYLGGELRSAGLAVSNASWASYKGGLFFMASLPTTYETAMTRVRSSDIALSTRSSLRGMDSQRTRLSIHSRRGPHFGR